MSEQKVVKCRCAKQMKLDHGIYPLESTSLWCHTPYWAMYRCSCGWISPICYASTAQEAEEAAYLAATSRPPNLPLTNAQVMGMSGLDAVWIVNTSHIGIKPVAWLQQELRDVFADVWSAKKLFFAAPPTPEDIAAASARKERT